jgi:hypothetical protein
MAGLFGGAVSTLTAQPSAAPSQPSAARSSAPGSTPAAPPDLNTLISEAARDLAEYQRLTAEGKLGEAGQRLESLKRKLDQLASQRR